MPVEYKENGRCSVRLVLVHTVIGLLATGPCHEFSNLDPFDTHVSYTCSHISSSTSQVGPASPHPHPDKKYVPVVRICLTCSISFIHRADDQLLWNDQRYTWVSVVNATRETSHYRTRSSSAGVSRKFYQLRVPLLSELKRRRRKLDGASRTRIQTCGVNDIKHGVSTFIERAGNRRLCKTDMMAQKMATLLFARCLVSLGDVYFASET